MRVDTWEQIKFQVYVACVRTSLLGCKFHSVSVVVVIIKFFHEKGLGLIFDVWTLCSLYLEKMVKFLTVIYIIMLIAWII